MVSLLDTHRRVEQVKVKLDTIRYPKFDHENKNNNQEVHVSPIT